MADVSDSIPLPSEAISAMRDRLGELINPLFDALSQSGMAVAVTGPCADDNPILYANAAFAELTGYPLDELVSRNCRLLQFSGTDQASVAAISQALSRGESITIDLLNQRKDGESFWNRLHITPVGGEAGAPAFFLSTQIDVSDEHMIGKTRVELAAVHRQLGEARERLRMAQAVAGAAGAWEWDITNDTLLIDARFAGLYGLDSVAAANGLPTSAFFGPIHPDDRMRVKIAVAGALEGAEVFAKAYRIVTADGAVLWVQARGRTHLDENDEPVRFAGILTDITQQRRIEDRLTVAQTAGGVGTFEYLSGFGTVDVSEQFCQLLGLRVTDALPVVTINALVHPEDRPLIGGPDDQVPGRIFREFRINRADTGEARWMARRGENRSDGGNSGFRFVGVIYDVTAAKLAEMRLLELTETLEERVELRTQERDRVWNLSGDLFCVCDFSGNLRAVNPAWQAVLGRSEAELIDSKFEALVHPDDLSVAHQQFNILATMTSLSDFDCRLRHKDGSYRWINWTAFPEGNVFYGVGRDVTQRKHLEDLLRQSQKMEAIGQLTGGLAHDFNNLLTGIMGGMNMVRSRIAAGRINELDRLIDMSIASAERAAALTHRLLAFSRRQSLDSRAVDVNALIASMEDLLRRTLGERISITLVLSDDAWLIIGDDNQLENAILNLAINARDAMADGGRLTISTRNATLGAGFGVAQTDLKPGDYLKIEIADTGSGMTAEVLSKAFEPFFTTKPIGHGTGLGLSMVYGFAQQSNGRADIESELGVGTTVSLYLPRFEAVASEITPVPAVLEAARGAGETILVVEDDTQIRPLIVEVLGELGYTILEAPDGETAMRILASDQRVDLMISDVGLPDINGRQLVEGIRKSRPDVGVLLMTGYAAGAIDRAKFLGPDLDLIFKPFTMDDLANRVRRIIEQSA